MASGSTRRPKPRFLSRRLLGHGSVDIYLGRAVNFFVEQSKMEYENRRTLVKKIGGDALEIQPEVDHAYVKPEGCYIPANYVQDFRSLHRSTRGKRRVSFRLVSASGEKRFVVRFDEQV